MCIPNFELPVMGNLAALASTAESGAPLGRYYDNCGGHVLTGLLAAPLYALFGDSYLTLKLVPVGLGLGTLFLTWSVLARHYDRRAADLFALLFVLGPPTLAKYSMLAKGNHFENLFFQVLVLALFLRMHARGVKPLDVFATAAAAGFAIFFYFGSVVLVASLGLVHLAVRGRRTWRELPATLAGLVLGLAPLAWFQLAAHGRPLEFLSGKLGGASRGGWSGLAARVEALFTEVLPRAGVFEDLGPVPGRIAEALFLALFALAWIGLSIALVRRVLALRGSKEAADERARLAAWKLLPFVAYLPLFALFVSATRFDFDPYGAPVEVGGYRYLVPHFLFALCVLALAAAELARRSGASRAFGRALAGGALLTGAFTLPIADWRMEHTGYGARYAGHAFMEYPNVVLRDPERRSVGTRIPWDPERVIRELAGLAPAHAREAWIGVGHYAAWAQRLARRDEGAVLSLDELVAPYPAELQGAMARGAGGYLRNSTLESGDRARLARELEALAAEAHALLPALAEGLCLDLRFPLVRRAFVQVTASAELEPLLPAALLPHFRRGQGVQLGRIAARGLDPDLALVRWLAPRIPSADEHAFWYGFGFGLAEGAELCPPPPHAEALVPAAFRGRVLEGYDAASRITGAQGERSTHSE